MDAMTGLGISGQSQMEEIRSPQDVQQSVLHPGLVSKGDPLLGTVAMNLDSQACAE